MMTLLRELSPLACSIAQDGNDPCYPISNAVMTPFIPLVTLFVLHQQNVKGDYRQDVLYTDLSH